VANSTTTGAASEYYVMVRLFTRGLIAAIAPTGRLPNADIIVNR